MALASSETLSVVRNNLSSALYLTQNDLMWEQYISDFDEQMNTIYDNFFNYVQTDKMKTWIESDTIIDSDIDTLSPITVRNITKSNCIFYTSSYDIVNRNDGKISLNENMCYDFIRRNLGGICEKSYIEIAPTINTIQTGSTYEAEPEWE